MTNQSHEFGAESLEIIKKPFDIQICTHSKGLAPAGQSRHGLWNACKLISLYLRL